MNAGHRPAGNILRGTITSLGVRLLDLPTRYGFHLLVAAKLGVVAAGQFYIVFSIMIALAGLGRLGIDRAVTRQIAVAMALDQPGQVRDILRRAYLLTLGESVLVAALFAATSAFIADTVFHKPDLTLPLMLGALSIVPQNLSVVAAGGLAGLQRIGHSQMIYSWLWPALFCVAALALGVDVNRALVFIAAAFALTAAIGAGLLWHFVRRIGQGERQAAPPLVRIGLSFFTLELNQLLLSSAPAILLGIVASSQVVGAFSLAWRIALIINVLISGVASMAAPRFAAIHARNDAEALTRTATQVVALVLGLSIVPALVMLIVPGLLLGLFGQGFSQGAVMLQILAVGQLGAACFTAMPELLGMTDHAATLRRVNFMALAVLAVTTALLVPWLEGEGAALAISITVIANGLAAALAAHRLLRIAPLHAIIAAIRRRAAT